MLVKASCRGGQWAVLDLVVSPAGCAGMRKVADPGEGALSLIPGDANAGNGALAGRWAGRRG